jgi:UDP-N-acetylmuramyl pentapeptide phosphotransferase/UDP-N-acetylglucosamine-1-phosphate transferase
MQLLSPVVAAAVTAGVLAALLGRVRGLPVDVANERSLHAGEVPRIGGVALLAGCAAALALSPVATLPLPALLAAAGLALLSFLDDWRSLPVLPRLLGHLVAAAVVVLPLGLPWGAALAALLAVAWMTNLYNFMDGADGLAGGMAALGFAAYGLAALPADPGLAWTGFTVSAAAFAFLGFNFPPARVFMGDAGSIPLGFLAAALGLAGWQGGSWPAWFPCLVFSPFIVDASVTLGRRLLRRQRVWQAHREHAYQRLILAGWSHRRLACAFWILGAAAAGSALALLGRPPGWQLAGLAGWGLGYAVLLVAIEHRWGNGTPPRKAGRKPANPDQEKPSR